MGALRERTAGSGFLPKIPFNERLRGRFGYSEYPMGEPPSEQRENVLQFELTEGCSRNGVCTFCNQYPNRWSELKAG